MEGFLAAEGSDAHLGALMKSAQDGDNDAYAALLRLLVPVIKRVVSQQCRFGLEVDDVVQDVLLSLHSVRHTYDPSRPFMPWLASIARHRATDAQRRRGRVTRNESAVPELPETFSSDDSNKNLDGPGDAELLKRAIADLPPGQRQAVEMLKLKELSLKEAASASGMTVAALKVAVHRGLKTLRERLASNSGDGNA